MGVISPPFLKVFFSSHLPFCLFLSFLISFQQGLLSACSSALDKPGSWKPLSTSRKTSTCGYSDFSTSIQKPQAADSFQLRNDAFCDCLKLNKQTQSKQHTPETPPPYFTQRPRRRRASQQHLFLCSFQTTGAAHITGESSQGFLLYRRLCSFLRGPSSACRGALRFNSFLSRCTRLLSWH